MSWKRREVVLSILVVAALWFIDAMMAEITYALWFVDPPIGVEFSDYPVDTIWTVTENGGRVDWSHSGNNLIAFDRVGADGFYDVYIMTPEGEEVVCLTDRPGFVPQKHNGQPVWHLSGHYIVFQAEKDENFDPDDRHFVSSEVSTPGRGWNCDLWCVDLQDTSFTRLTNLPTRKTYSDTTPTSGVLHPHFSHDGTKLLWSELLNGEADLGGRGDWGQWRLNLSKFVVDSSGPRLDSTEHFEPGEATFYESHGFSPDDSLIIFSGNLEPGQHQIYMDIYSMNIYTHELKRLTFTTEDVWDEHAHYSLDGREIVWMCSEGYSFIPDQWRATLSTDYWLMNADGSDKNRLTYFNELGHPEHTGERVIMADCSWSPDGGRLVGFGAFVDTALGTGKWKIVMIEFEGMAGSRGDVNRDGQINILDVLKAVTIILEIEPPTDYEIWAADCNGDETIDVLDLVGIVNVILGIGLCSP
ncbi:MAG: dockerin type I domain-containing protein [bacterium]